MVVAHIGLMKTGSTSLQDFLIKDNRITTRVHDKRYYRENEGEKESFEQKVLVISDENLSREYNKVSSLVQSVERILSYHEIDKVIIVIRNQFSFLESCYKHHVKQTYDGSSFGEWLGSDAGHSQLKLCYYGNFLEELEKSFGVGNVRFLLFEEMIEDNKSFVESFYKELEMPPFTEADFPKSNQPFRNNYYGSKLWFNRTFGRSELFRGNVFEKILIKTRMSIVNQPIKVWQDFEEAQLLELESDFRNENQRLVNKLGLNLEKYNYLL